jgi:hypothetical protein
LSSGIAKTKYNRISGLISRTIDFIVDIFASVKMTGVDSRQNTLLEKKCFASFSKTPDLGV